jgi:hypothetical protein
MYRKFFNFFVRFFFPYPSTYISRTSTSDYLKRVILMVDTHTAMSPLARLVLFMICLALAGSIVAGAHYYTVDLPQQKDAANHPPDNGANPGVKCTVCQSNCVGKTDYYTCLSECKLIC